MMPCPRRMGRCVNVPTGPELFSNHFVSTQHVGDELGVPLPQGSSTHNLQRLARGMKLGSSDSSSILRVYETALGRTVKQ